MFMSWVLINHINLQMNFCHLKKEIPHWNEYEQSEYIFSIFSLNIVTMKYAESETFTGWFHILSSMDAFHRHFVISAYKLYYIGLPQFLPSVKCEHQVGTKEDDGYNGNYPRREEEDEWQHHETNAHEWRQKGNLK